MDSIGLFVFVAALGLHLFFVTRGLGHTLEGPHDFRQAQTAITTYYLERDGLRLGYETPVFGSPAAIPFEFPTYQFAVVGICRVTGLPLDVAGRVTSLLFFYLTLPFVWLTLRRLHVPQTGRWLALAAILSSPAYIFYSRAFLIESAALFTSWLFVNCVVALILASAERNPTPDSVRTLAALWITAVLCGGLAALTKITTFAVHLAALMLFWAGVEYSRRAAPSSRTSRAAPGFARLLWVGTASAAALLIGLAWVRYTDVLKLRNPSPVVHALTSTALRPWNFGVHGALLRAATWRDLAARFSEAGAGSLLMLAILPLLLPFARGQRRLIAGLLAAWLIGPLVFTNLYAVHDYYWYANTVFFAIACGIALGAGLSVLQQNGSRVVTKFTMLAWVAAQFASYRLSSYYSVQRFPPGTATAIAEAVRRETPPGSSVLVFGFDWNSMIPYYARRRAFMTPWSDENYFAAGSQQAIRNLAADGHPVGAIVFGGATAGNATLQQRVLSTLAGRFSRTDAVLTATVYVRGRVHASDGATADAP